MAWGEKGAKKPILSRGYRVTVELGAVSQREIMAYMGGTSSEDGVKIGKVQGMKALQELTVQISRDPNWLYLNSYVRLARAREIIENSIDPVARMQAAQGLLGLLSPLPYTPAEAKILRDGMVSANLRAEQANELRAQYLGVAEVKGLPAGQKLGEAQAEKLFNDPAVERALAQGEVVRQTLGLILSAMAPITPKVKAQAEAAPPKTKVEIPTLTRPTMPDPVQDFPGEKKKAKPAPAAEKPKEAPKASAPYASGPGHARPTDRSTGRRPQGPTTPARGVRAAGRQRGGSSVAGGQKGANQAGFAPGQELSGQTGSLLGGIFKTEPCARLRQPTGILRCWLRSDLDVAIGYALRSSLAGRLVCLRLAVPDPEIICALITLMGCSLRNALISIRT